MSAPASIEWCAGFFEGEGNFRLNKAKGKQIYPHIQIAQVHREPLDAFQATFNLGVVRGPYGPYQTNKQAYYNFCAYGAPAVAIAEQLLPFLYHKGVQVREVLEQHVKNSSL